MRHSYRTLFAAAVVAASFPVLAQENGPVRTWQSIRPPANWAKPPAPPAAAPKPVNPVPEPSQWALMAAGVGLVAWIVRRRSKRNSDKD